jgi:hypothetical protein
MERQIALDRLTFITGGQTGIDRAVLDFCLDHRIGCGGWCPEGRSAEDGPIDLRYPVKVLPGASYEVRTMANVKWGDATVIIYQKEMTGGTLLSYEYVSRIGKPHLLLDMGNLTAAQAAGELTQFILKEHLFILNFSGPRQSEWEQGYTKCISMLHRFYRDQKDTLANKYIL